MILTAAFYEAHAIKDNDFSKLGAITDLYGEYTSIYMDTWLEEKKVSAANNPEHSRNFFCESPEFAKIQKQYDLVIEKIYAWCNEHNISGAEQWTDLRHSIANDASNYSPDIFLAMFSGAKRALESIYLIFKKSNSSEIPKNKELMQDLINDGRLTLCKAGLYTGVINLSMVLSTDTLASIFQTTRYRIIQQFAIDYVSTHKLSESSGDEIHYANALCNSVTEDFKLPLILDIQAPSDLDWKHLQNFRTICLENLDVPFIEQTIDYLFEMANLATEYKAVQQFENNLNQIGIDKDFLLSVIFNINDDDIDKCTIKKDAKFNLQCSLLKRLENSRHLSSRSILNYKIPCSKYTLHIFCTNIPMSWVSTYDHKVRAIVNVKHRDVENICASLPNEVINEYGLITLAARSNLTVAVRTFIHSGADVNTKYKSTSEYDGFSALDFALRNKNTKSIDLLFKSGARCAPNIISFKYAIEHKKIDLLITLLNHPDMINSGVDMYNFGSVLIMAAMQNDTELVKALLHCKNIDLSWHNNVEPEKYWNAFSYAVNYENVEMLEALINHPKTLDSANDPYNLSDRLLDAARANNIALVKILLKYKHLDLTRKTVDSQYSGYDILDFALFFDNWKLLGLIIDYRQTDTNHIKTAYERFLDQIILVSNRIDLNIKSISSPIMRPNTAGILAQIEGNINCYEKVMRMLLLPIIDVKVEKQENRSFCTTVDSCLRKYFNPCVLRIDYLVRRLIGKKVINIEEAATLVGLLERLKRANDILREKKVYPKNLISLHNKAPDLLATLSDLKYELTRKRCNTPS